MVKLCVVSLLVVVLGACAPERVPVPAHECVPDAVCLDFRPDGGGWGYWNCIPFDGGTRPVCVLQSP